MRVRACTGCRKYIIIRPEDPKNSELVKDFEDLHRGHTLVSVELEEVKGSYENIEGDLGPEAILTKEVIQEELKKCRSVNNGKKSLREAFGALVSENPTPLMKYFEKTTDAHHGKYAIYEGSITKNYINWLEKQLVSKFLS